MKPKISLGGLMLIQLLLPALRVHAAAYSCSPSGQKCCPAGQKCSEGGLPTCPAGYKRPSWMWGCAGEAWDRNRLPVDWSFAGYASGEKAIPWIPQSTDVKAFGAKGDGRTDDTQAIVRAIEAAKWGSAVYFPPGKYVMTQRVDIRKQVVLRGAGKDKTTIYFANSLADKYGNRGGWGHGTCFLNFWGWNPVRNDITRLAGVTGGAAKGSYKLYVDNTGNIKQGQWVRLTLQDSSEVFKSILMGGLMDPGWPKTAKNLVRFTSRVKSVGPGGLVTLERPLPWEVKAQWGPTLHAVKPTITEAGVEFMTIEFKWTKYPGHLKEDGFNAIHFNQLAQSWVRNVRFLNADTAIYWWGVSFSTVQDVELDVTKSRASCSSPCRDWWGGKDRHGHRGIWSEFGENNLFQRIAIKSPYFHDFSVATGETGSVWTNSWGTDLNLDFHKGAPYANLYTDLNLGLGSRAFRSGGGEGVGPNSASYQTFWNLKAQQPLTLPDNNFGPQLTFVGLQTRESASARVAVRWLQDWATYPSNLYLSMRKVRLGW